MKRVLIVTRDPVISFRQMPGGVDHTPDGEYQFLINETDAEVDFVVVVGKGLRVPTEFRVAPQNTILMTGEPHSILEYPKGYCSQFGLVCACQPEIKGANVVYTPPLLPWYVGVDFSQNSDNRFTMNYEDVKRATPDKTKLIAPYAEVSCIDYAPGIMRLCIWLSDGFGGEIIENTEMMNSPLEAVLL